MAKQKTTVEIVAPQQTKITDWYDKLVFDLKKLQFTTLVKFYWDLGNRIQDDIDKFGKPEYGSKFIENLSKEIQIGVRDIQKSLQFKYQFPEWRHVVSQLEGSSWRKIRNDILPEHKEKPEPVELPDGKYNVIYADPPWNYNDTCEDGAIQSKGADKHYPTMTIQQLCKLNVQSLCVDDCILFLWVTSPLLEESFEIINSWGFNYKASFVWDKIKHNMGHYNSVRHEFLLMCTRGSFTPENLVLFDSVVSVEKSKKHSEKPEIFYEMIEQLYPSGKKIELFARKTRKGWSSWGNEI